MIVADFRCNSYFNFFSLFASKIIYLDVYVISLSVAKLSFFFLIRINFSIKIHNNPIYFTLLGNIYINYTFEHL